MGFDRYTDRLLRSQEGEPSFAYLLDTLLQSRIATANESNREYFDEDVNVYVTLLLNSMVSNRFHEEAAAYVVDYETDLPQILDRASSYHTKYQIYRANADFLLLRTGLFQLPQDLEADDEKIRNSVERGKAYYRMACAYTDRIPARYRALSTVLAKLAYGFETYREVLSFMRVEYLNLVETLGEHQMGQLYREMDEAGANETLRVSRDKLLDAFLAYQKDPTDANRDTFEAALGELTDLAPDEAPDWKLDS